MPATAAKRNASTIRAPLSLQGYQPPDPIAVPAIYAWPPRPLAGRRCPEAHEGFNPKSCSAAS